MQPLYSETYTFTTLSDDGARLWVNGQQLINNWTVHPPTENSGTITLTAGQKYDLKLEYYEHTGGAVAKLSWSSASQTKAIIPQTQLYPALAGSPPPPPPPPPTGTGTGTGLAADYFNSVDLSGSPVLHRTDATVAFDFGTGSPAAGSGCRQLLGALDGSGAAALFGDLHLHHALR